MIEISSNVFISVIAIVGALFLHSLIIYTLREVQELSYANVEIVKKITILKNKKKSLCYGLGLVLGAILHIYWGKLYPRYTYLLIPWMSIYVMDIILCILKLTIFKISTERRRVTKIDLVGFAICLIISLHLTFYPY